MDIAMQKGRPEGTTQSRDKLVKAALKLFSTLPYNKVSTRKVAAEAGVNAALIHYYFTDKAGLFEATIKETISPLAHQMSKLLSEKDITGVGDVMKVYYKVMAPNPDLPRLMFQVMMMEEGAVQQTILLKLLAPNLQMLGQAFASMQSGMTGLKPGVDPLQARLSFMGLMIFPLIMPKLIANLQGIQMTEEFLLSYADHTLQLLQEGMFSMEAEDA